MAGQRGVVGLDVELEVFEQAVLAEEVQAGRRVGIVLVLGRFFRLGLDVEGPGETELLLVVHRHVHELGEVVHLAGEIGVEQRGVALASAPEGVAFAAQLMGPLHRLLHLRGGVAEHVGAAARGRAVHVAGMDEILRRAPEQLDPGVLLQLLQLLADGVEVLVRFGERLAVRGDVAVVPAVVRGADLRGELEHRVRAGHGILHGAFAGVPRALRRAPAEHVAARPAHRVPVHHREAQVLLHGLALDELARVVVLEGQGVLGARAFELDVPDLREVLLAHDVCWIRNVGGV